MNTGQAHFDTALGCCAVGWSERGLTTVRLPGVPLPATARAAAEWPPFVAEAVAGMQALLAGEPQDLLHVLLDDADIGPFERRVYAACRALPPGHTCTYGELARAIEDPSALRAVGQALGRNPWPLVVPCHRVLAAGGRLGGFSAPGGADTKQRLLIIESALVRRPDQLF
jgi:methylated-DNA-[protein]-cysteine S-methyltransferase